MGKRILTFVRRLFGGGSGGYILFWSWNVIFLAFMILGFAPQVLPDMIRAVREGLIPATFLAYAVVLTAIPVAAVVLGFTLLRRSPSGLLALGYGVEGPLMLMLAIRFLAIREATPAVNLLMSIATLGMAALLWQILDGRIDERRQPLPYLRVIGLTLLFAMGLYVAAWLAFYAVPLAVEGGKAFVETLPHIPDILRSLWRVRVDLYAAPFFVITFSVLGLILMVHTATLFVGLPIAMPLLAIRAWWRGVRAVALRHSQRATIALAAATVITCAVLFVLTNRQPQHQAFALLRNPPTSVAEARALVDKQETLRAGLLNAYLASFRYLSAVGEVTHVSEMYKWSLQLSSEQAAQVQQLYEAIARPVLYEPANPARQDAAGLITRRTGLDINVSFRREPQEAATLYETFFDRPINDGERETVVRAARSTWMPDQAQAAWQAVDDREVHLVRQEVTIAEHGDWAEVELYEVYQNQTSQRQEVIYYFSLPESAVITGVWLGNSPDRAERFVYRVAPRGAAQEVYRREVQRNVDPALVEQIGPRQYRLRAFPVEPKRWHWDDTTRDSILQEGPPLYLWLTWRVLVKDNAWPMPRLAEKRNVYWDAQSVRSVNGALTKAGEPWLPVSAPAQSPVKPVAHRVDLPGGESVVVRPVSQADLPKLPGNLRLAVVLDQSRSMVQHAADVKAALVQIGKAANPASTDVYLTASPYRGEGPSRTSLDKLDPASIAYLGGQNAAALLAQFNQLATGKSCDAILVLTDGSGYELGGGDTKVSIPNAPVWMVHLDGDFSLGYDDATLEAIQASGGGAVGSVEEALTRLAVALDVKSSLSSGGVASDVIDGYVWSIIPTQAASGVTAAGDDFAPMAARRLILATMRRERSKLDQLATLDRLHDIAIKNSIVTPYSSMLVLVNVRQQELLDDLQSKGDRFQRESEEVGQTQPPGQPSVTGVPEPEEWLLLALAAAMIGWYVRTQPHPKPVLASHRAARMSSSGKE